MPAPSWSAEAATRRIAARVIVEGDLVLQTPAHFGNGDGDDLTDMPLLVDPLDGRTPLLTGASIAGALRSYLRSVQGGYHRALPEPEDPDAAGERHGAAVSLFGGFRGDDLGEQSPLIVDDALGRAAGMELRDGVRIAPASRTADEDKLFNLQLWQAGTTFPLRFELLLRKDEGTERLRALATALHGFNTGDITLGARKRRGYGRVHVAGWRVRTYDLMSPDGLLARLRDGNRPLEQVPPEPDIRKALGAPEPLTDRREEFRLHAVFSLASSLLIRSGGGQDDHGPDMVHLHARQAGGPAEPVLSGTSLAGALRARATRIARTLAAGGRADNLISEVFGKEMIGNVKPHASRLITEERVIRNARTDLVQNRVGIDRFTGGARETALFNEQPAFGADDTLVTVDVRLLNPADREIGLLLLLLKDLWTEDLPLGGESGVGRGRLRGREARVTCRRAGTEQTWDLKAGPAGVAVTGAERGVLEDFVGALNKHLEEAGQ